MGQFYNFWNGLKVVDKIFFSYYHDFSRLIDWIMSLWITTIEKPSVRKVIVKAPKNLFISKNPKRLQKARKRVKFRAIFTKLKNRNQNAMATKNRKIHHFGSVGLKRDRFWATGESLFSFWQFHKKLPLKLFWLGSTRRFFEFFQFRKINPYPWILEKIQNAAYFCSARHISPHIGICHLKLAS